jgi:hypothetical protein
MKRINYFNPKTGRRGVVHVLTADGEFNGMKARQQDWNWARAQLRHGRIKPSEFITALSMCGSFWKLRVALPLGRMVHNGMVKR